MEVLAYWGIVRKHLLLVLALGFFAALGAGLVEVRRVPLYRTSTTLYLNPAATNPLLPYQATNTVGATANTYIELMRTRSFADMVAKQSGLALAADQVLAALSTQYVLDTQFFRITATHADPSAAQVIANTAAETLIAANAARRQAEQAQIQSQLGQDPERQQLMELRDSLRVELDLFTQRIESTRDQIAAMEARIPSERNDQQLGELRAQLVQQLDSRSATLNSLAQVQSSLSDGSSATAAIPTDTAIVVDRAPLPGAPLPHSTIGIILMGLACGLAAGVALALGLDYIDYTVKTPEALEQVYGARPLGVIGVVSDSRKPVGERQEDYQLTASATRSPAAEAIRALRTGVQVAGLSRPIRSLLVTSAGPGEGKSFVAANLAVSIAQYGQTVILVDLDLHKPQIHNIFAREREPGFTNLVMGHEAEALAAIKPQIQELAARLRSQANERVAVAPFGPNGHIPLTAAGVERLLRQAEAEAPELAGLTAGVRRRIEQADTLGAYLRPGGQPNLLLLTAGTIPPHPSELLGSQRAAQIMERLTEYADLVIYDTPPAGVMTDAVILAPRVDAVLQVVRAGHTRIDLIRRCKLTLEQAGARMLGPVLNQLKRSEMGSYGYYYYSYGEQGKAGRGHRRNGKAPPDEATRSNGALPHPQPAARNGTHRDEGGPVDASERL